MDWEKNCGNIYLIIFFYFLIKVIEVFEFK